MATAPRKPQDHKPSQEEINAVLQREFSEVEGSELIVPFSKIKGSDQLRIIGRIQSLGIGADTDADTSDIDMDNFADFVDWIATNFTVDQKKFEDWSGGTGGISRTMNLCMALLGELGKGMNSDNS